APRVASRRALAAYGSTPARVMTGRGAFGAVVPAGAPGLVADARARATTRSRTPRTFFALALALTVYVACCTGARDTLWLADAWEHEAAVTALVDRLWQPGNPVYATPVPSVRYSPYSVALALVARASGTTPHDVLSAAAVANTVLLAAGVLALLAAWGEQALGAQLLLVMVALYGAAPGYANSYALADLPWHQVNPSAFAFAVVLLALAAFRALRGVAALAAVAVALAVATLSHAMTGLFGLVALATMAATDERPSRALARVAVVGVVVALLAAAWPWYGFVDAIRRPAPGALGFNRTILGLMLTVWCAPGLLLLVATLPLRGRPFVRWCLAGAASCIVLASLAFVVRSPVLGRLPVPAMMFVDGAVAASLADRDVLRPGSWPDRWRALWSRDRMRSGAAAVETIAALLLLYGLAPQLAAIPREPHLARAWIAPLFGRDARQTHIAATMRTLLEPIRPGDVVLADSVTAWPMPSFRARIVSAAHDELFFGDAGDAERAAILARWNVRWIVVDPAHVGADVAARLEDARAVVRRTDGL